MQRELDALKDLHARSTPPEEAAVLARELAQAQEKGSKAQLASERATQEVPSTYPLIDSGLVGRKVFW